jgi:hypothetical protein
MSEKTLLFVPGIAFLLCVALLVWSSFFYLKRKRTIQDIPTANIRAAAQAYVEIFSKT